MCHFHKALGSYRVVQDTRRIFFFIKKFYFFVLQQLRPHMLPTMYARIYLLQNLQIILHTALNILNIEPIAQM